MQNIKEGLIAGPEIPVGKVVRMRVAPFTGYGVDRLYVVRTHFVQHLVRQGDDIVFTNAWLQVFVNHVINAVDHAGGLSQKLDFVPVLDFTRFQHDLLAIDHVQTSLL